MKKLSLTLLAFSALVSGLPLHAASPGDNYYDSRSGIIEKKYVDGKIEEFIKANSLKRDDTEKRFTGKNHDWPPIKGDCITPAGTFLKSGTPVDDKLYKQLMLEAFTTKNEGQSFPKPPREDGTSQDCYIDTDQMAAGISQRYFSFLNDLQMEGTDTKALRACLGSMGTYEFMREAEEATGKPLQFTGSDILENPEQTILKGTQVAMPAMFQRMKKEKVDASPQIPYEEKDIQAFNEWKKTGKIDGKFLEQSARDNYNNVHSGFHVHTQGSGATMSTSIQYLSKLGKSYDVYFDNLPKEKFNPSRELALSVDVDGVEKPSFFLQQSGLVDAQTEEDAYYEVIYNSRLPGVKYKEVKAKASAMVNPGATFMAYTGELDNQLNALVDP